MLRFLNLPYPQSTPMRNIVLILFCFLTFSSFAQSLQDSFALAISVSRTSRQKSEWVKPVAGVAFAGLIYCTYNFWDPKIQAASQRNTGGFKNFIARGVSDLGTGKFQTLSLTTTSLVAFVSGNERLKRTVLIWGGSLLINSITTELLKDGLQRHRPSSGNTFDMFDGRHGTEIHTSFPSAHTSNAFTTATVFATIYRDEKWVAPAAYTLATLVGLSRIHDNAHWASDVLAGAALGFLSAKAMHGLYNLASKKLLFIPQVGRQHAGLSLVYQW